MEFKEQLDLESLPKSSLIAIIEDLREKNKLVNESLNRSQLVSGENLTVAKQCLKVINK